jgi:predicted RNA-binding protein with RPS1 domain
MEGKKRNLTEDAVLTAVVEITEKQGFESLSIRDLAENPRGCPAKNRPRLSLFRAIPP